MNKWMKVISYDEWMNEWVKEKKRKEKERKKEKKRKEWKIEWKIERGSGWLISASASTYSIELLQN